MDSIMAQYGSSSSDSSCSGSSEDEQEVSASAASSDAGNSAAADEAGRAGDRKHTSEAPWVRAFAHVDGNWPSHVHVSMGNDAELRALCDRVISGAQQSIVGAGCSDTDATLVPMDDYHLSLSRPFVLQYDQISTFVDELRAALKWRRRFVVALSEATILVNDELTRSFLALCVSGGEKELLATIKCVDKCMKQFALPLYYEVRPATIGT